MTVQSLQNLTEKKYNLLIEIELIFLKFYHAVLLTIALGHYLNSFCMYNDSIDIRNSISKS